MYKFIILVLLFFILACSNEIIYSGKIINQDDLNNLNFKNKEKLINNFGIPSYIDPLENKFFYFSEKKVKKTIFKEEIKYSYIFVFEFDSNDIIVNQKVYNLSNKEDLILVKDETENNIIQRGLIEKIFGGVGPQQELPTSQ